jgi:predicted aminopeptidase
MSPLRDNKLRGEEAVVPMRLRSFIGVLCLLIPILLSGCATSVGYLWKQGGYLIRYSSGATSIASILKSSTSPPDLKTFLRTVEQVKKFAVNDIGLSENRNYTRYKKLDRDYLVNVVQASDPLSFTAYEWKYPLLGKLPYKGYYDPADAKAEAERLKKAGYDVIVRKVDAFSTLGFFRDPVYSFMQKYSAYELSSIIIHEETHATLFLKGQDQFNEELATYVGDQGALMFLKNSYGASSPAYERALAEQHDNALFLDFIMQLRAALAKVYGEKISKEAMLAQKAETIATYMKLFESKYRPSFQTASYRKISTLPINNAYLMLYGLYTEAIPLLARFNQVVCGDNLKTFMSKMKALSKERGAMMPKIERELQAAGG